MSGNSGGVKIEGKPSTNIKGVMVKIEAKGKLALESKAMAELKASIASVKGKLNKIG